MDCSPPGSSAHGVSQAKILEWAARLFSGDLLDPGIEPTSPTLAGGLFTTEPLGSHPEDLPWLRTDKHTRGLYACAGMYTHLGTHVVSLFFCAHHGWPSSLQPPPSGGAPSCSQGSRDFLSLGFPPTSLEVPLSLFSPQALPPLALEHVFLVHLSPALLTLDSVGRTSSKPGIHWKSPEKSQAWVITHRALCADLRACKTQRTSCSPVISSAGPITRPQLLPPAPACSHLRLPSSPPALPQWRGVSSDPSAFHLENKLPSVLLADARVSSHRLCFFLKSHPCE